MEAYPVVDGSPEALSSLSVDTLKDDGSTENVSSISDVPLEDKIVELGTEAGGSLVAHGASIDRGGARENGGTGHGNE